MVAYQQTKHDIVLEVKAGLTVHQFTVSDPELNHVVALIVSENS
jgi:hypothetical protein